MRRNDREITNRQEILDILFKCGVIRLVINTPNYPYVVPMNFGIEAEGQTLTLWFHSACEGMKLDLIKQDNRLGFEADCSNNIIAGGRACDYTIEYESVIGFGDMEICDDIESKLRGLRAIMRHYVPGEEFTFTDTELAAVCVLRLNVKQITGKRLKV